MAAASSTSCDDNKMYPYDVFLSFSGEDTRRNFVDHLNDALKGHGIHTFKDDERLQKGKEIKEQLLKSIADSKFCIIVFSKKYASSSWCLDELVKIMECQKTTHQTAFPVFYDVEPTEVRKQSGSVGQAFAKHTNKVVVPQIVSRTVGKALARHSKKKQGKWRKALKDAANLSGWELKNTADGHEAKVIKLVIERISLELRSIDIGVDDSLIGMEHRIQDLDSYLEIGSDDIRLVGIKGMGGAGKTTLAQAIFNKISFDFEGRSFVENVRENSKAPLLGLKKLQEQVLRDVLKDNNITVGGVNEGKNLMKKRLCGTRALIVLDDVDHKDQLEMLVGDPTWFKRGSRIIITTRDEQVLKAHRVKWILDVSLLSDDEAICLLSRHAFGKDIPPKEYKRRSCEVVNYAAGLPLTIKVLGSNLCGKDNGEWTDVLERLKTVPSEETLKILEISYDSLEDDHKEIFLDVACFLTGWEKENAMRMLESCGFYAKNGLRVLEQKSLITTLIDHNRAIINMHDQLVALGRNIVRRGHADEPNRHSRLWVQEEIEHVLANELVIKATRCIQLEIAPGIVLEGLKSMKKLRCLILNNWKSNGFSSERVKIDEACQHFPNALKYLCWYKYPHWCLPKTFEVNNLVALEMSHSNIEQLWEGGKVMKKLKFLVLDFTKLKSLDLGLTPNLERLNLQSCLDLINLYVHGGCLKSLLYLNLSGCWRLKSLLFIEQLESLEVLYLDRLYMEEFPNNIITGHPANSLLELHFSSNNIVEIPASIGNLHKLVSLVLGSCKLLKSLPESICSLQHLVTLDLQHTSIKKFPEDLAQMVHLEYLDLSGIDFECLPRIICTLKHLKTLLVRMCNLLKKLPRDIGQLESLEKLDLSMCYNIRDIPSSICKLKNLKELNLEGCRRLEKLSNKLGDLKRLRLLNIRDTGIDLPKSISSLKALKIYQYQLKRQVISEDFIRFCSQNDFEKLQMSDNDSYVEASENFRHRKLRCGGSV